MFCVGQLTPKHGAYLGMWLTIPSFVSLEKTDFPFLEGDNFKQLLDKGWDFESSSPCLYWDFVSFEPLQIFCVVSQTL